MSKDCIAAGSTHFACDCVLERLLVAESRVKELEAENAALKATHLCSDYTHQRIEMDARFLEADKWRAKRDDYIEGLRALLKLCEERYEKSPASSLVKCDKCDKCGRKDNEVLLCHDRDEDDVVRNLCSKCQSGPEYIAACPHCDARILIN